MRVFEDSPSSIGHTPLIALTRLGQGLGGRIFAKVEGRNPAYSVKCRVGASLVWQAEKSGKLKPGMTLLEASSGNTGIGLAMAAAAKGYKLCLVMQEGMSEERVKVLKMLGAELLLTDPALGMQGALQKAEALERAEPSRYYYTRQFENPANPLVHEQTTGPEIWADLDGRIDALVASVGTGGTLTGLGRYFKQVLKHDLLTVAVEPKALPAIARHLQALKEGRQPEVLIHGGHLIQGIGAGFVPANLDLGVVDRVEGVSDRDALVTTRRLAREEGLLCGISSGAAAFAALKLAAEPAMQGKSIVCILPDGGDRYVSTVLFSDLFEEKTQA